MVPQYLVLGLRYFAFNKATVQLILGLGRYAAGRRLANAWHIQVSVRPHVRDFKHLAATPPPRGQVARCMSRIHSSPVVPRLVYVPAPPAPHVRLESRSAHAVADTAAERVLGGVAVRRAKSPVGAKVVEQGRELGELAAALQGRVVRPSISRSEWAVLGRARGAGPPVAWVGSCSRAERPIHLVEVLLQGAYDNEARLGRADRLPGVAPRRSDEGHCRGGPSFQPCPGGKRTWRLAVECAAVSL